jgi:hypothetical protein
MAAQQREDEARVYDTYHDARPCDTCVVHEDTARLAGAAADSLALPISAQLLPLLQSHRHPLVIQGGIEIGRSSAHAQGMDSLLDMNTSSGAATTLGLDASVSVGRTQIVGQAGFSTAHGAYGGYGRLVALVASDGLLHLRRGWMLSGDLTRVGSSGVASATSGGLSVYYGAPQVVQGGIRLGRRWRAGSVTPVYTLELARTSDFTVGGMEGGVHLSLAATHTSYSGSRVPGNDSFPVVSYRPIRTRVPATFADFHIRPHLSRGAWLAEIDGGIRVGRSATLWDDPTVRFVDGTPVGGALTSGLAEMLVIQRERHNHVSGVVRLVWQPLPAISVIGEGGRRMSDPISGMTGVRYVGVSMRLGFDTRRSAVHARAVRSHARAFGISVSPRQNGGQPNVVTSGRDSMDVQMRTITVRGVTGNRVELAGDFTDWQPVLLTRRGGADTLAWCGQFIVRAGAHRVVIRVDGGAWQPPKGVPVVNDSFDGLVGLLVVP